MDLGIAGASHLGLGGWFLLLDDGAVVFLSPYQDAPQLVFADAPVWVLELFVADAAVRSVRAT